MNTEVGNLLEHISEKPWSSYTAADYSIEQWHNACLIHLHDGAPTSKNQCKIPVKTPNGALNRNGVHAAAAALAGARGGVNAPSEKIAAAKNAVRRLYSQLDEKAPPSMRQSGLVEDILEHHGVKGMRWGTRKSGGGVSRSTSRTVFGKSPKSLTSQQLNDRIKRMETEKRYNDLNKKDVGKGQQFAVEILAGSGRKVATTLITGAALLAIRQGLQKKIGEEHARMITSKSK